jgi:SAM-dependent methyltransferase
MGFFCDWMDNTFYPSFKGHWDNDMFREFTLNYLTAEHRLLDIGAGRGALPQMNFKGIAAEVTGVDPDEIVKTNPYLDKAFVGLGDDMPFLQADYFDMVVCNNVLEHINDPDKFFAEIKRVIKPGGIFITKTPNYWHYMAIIASITPTWFHRFYHRLNGTAVGIDVFPTIYKVNTPKDQKHYFNKYGFQISDLKLIEGRPEYLRMSFVTYLVGFLYERIVNTFSLNKAKIVMFTIAYKDK